MKKLSELKKDAEGVITAVNGDPRFISRITSIGLTPGCPVTVIKNEKNRPLLVYSRDTMIALNRKECGQIEVEGGRA
ncbi:MAG: ferrous iron transport protein A [Lachnospiraceae bacterium]|nr:ferrous iron transport protein A [Lachnospiraceae bacterium]